MIFDAAAKKVHIDAEELCHTVINRASIDVRGTRVWADGTKIDELLSDKYGTDYREKVECSRVLSRGGLFYDLHGICDGIIHRDGVMTVCVNRYVNGYTSALDSNFTAEFVGLAVAYSAMIAEREMLGNINFRVTFFHNSRDIKTIEKTYTRKEMSDALLRLIDLYRPFAALEAERVCVRLPNCRTLEFPYREIRPQQRDFMIEVLRAAKQHGKALIEAPTGTGKTIAALYPSFKAMGSGLAEKVFYFTSKNTTALAALEAAKKLSASSGIRAIHITAKERLCPVKLRDPYKCTPDKCPRAKGHYMRLADAIADIVTANKVIDSAAISEYADKYSICPYEFSLDLTNFCDAVICDCNYLIDETAYFRRYFSPCDTEAHKYIFLFDEAHNLLERAKSCYSAELHIGDFRRFMRETSTVAQNSVSKSIADIEFYIDSMRELCADSMEEGSDGVMRGFSTSHAFDKPFYELLVAFTKSVDMYLRSPSFGSLPDSISDLSSKAKKYITAMELFDGCFVNTIYVSGDEVVTKILCLDPSVQLAKKMSRGIASVMFSATLTPTEYYASLYGAPDAVQLKLDCPYDRENLCICIMDKLSVKYQYRSQNAAAVADAIMGVVGRRDGNYMVYFPSYEYMSEVQTLFKYKYPHIKTVVQAKNMSETSRREFLDSFRTGMRTSLVGFSVLGGIYAEGIDLVGDRLIGSVIVGVGMTRPTSESEIFREYYDDKYELGKEYAYIYPGFNRVLQAAGRVIRTENDRGVVVFIDERYAEQGYRDLFPTQYRTAKFVGDTPSLSSVIDKFWEKEQS